VDQSQLFRSVGRGAPVPQGSIAARFGRGSPTGAGRGAPSDARMSDRFGLDEPTTPAPMAALDTGARLGIFTAIDSDREPAAHVPQGPAPASGRRRLFADTGRAEGGGAPREQLVGAASVAPRAPVASARDEKSYVLDVALQESDLLTGLPVEDAEPMSVALQAILANGSIPSSRAEHVLRWGRGMLARARGPQFLTALNALVTPPPDWEIEAENAAEAAEDAAAAAAAMAARAAQRNTMAAAAEEAEAKAKKAADGGKGGKAGEVAKGGGKPAEAAKKPAAGAKR
jgi:hypothetical protein